MRETHWQSRVFQGVGLEACLPAPVRPCKHSWTPAGCLSSCLVSYVSPSRSGLPACLQAPGSCPCSHQHLRSMHGWHCYRVYGIPSMQRSRLNCAAGPCCAAGAAAWPGALGGGQRARPTARAAAYAWPDPRGCGAAAEEGAGAGDAALPIACAACVGECAAWVRGGVCLDGDQG